MNTLAEEEAAPGDSASAQINTVESKLTPAAQRNRKLWGKIPLSFLLVCGILFLALLLYAYITIQTPIVKVSIDAGQVINDVMARSYGKYSESHKGWLYLGEGHRTYLMRVVQKAKLQGSKFGDELYFVASGVPLNGAPGAIYGLHIVRADEAHHDGSTLKISAAYNYDGDAALTPEDVRFEALSAKVFGWVLKVQDGLDPEKTNVLVRNKVYAAHARQIALLATFNSSLQRNPGISCEEANRRYQAMNDDDDDEAEEVNEVKLPRCNDAKWDYRTEPVAGDTLASFIVTGKGMVNGAEFKERRWTLVFNPKSYSYIVPIELQTH
jgi:hypothetical protein